MSHAGQQLKSCLQHLLIERSVKMGNGHYDSVAEDYEKAFFYSSVDYRDWVLGHLLRHFRLPDQARMIQ